MAKHVGETQVSEIPKPIDDEPVIGAAPEGATDRESASRAVREMFTAIAPRYDLLNHLLSANIDKLWWRRTARVILCDSVQARRKVLDLCCGTGDMAFALRRESASAQITGADFSHAMLVRAAAKSSADRSSHDRPVKWIEADALQLPFPDQSFDLVTSAFGFRNLADYDAGLREIRRVLRPGGEVGILEFSEPRRSARKGLQLVLQIRAAQNRQTDFGCAKRVFLSPRLSRPLSPTARDAATNASRRLPRSLLDSLHPRHRWPVPRQTD